MDETKSFVIAYRGLKPGLHTFRFDVDGGLFAAYENSEIKDGHCRVEVEMMRSEKLLELDIAIAGGVVGEVLWLSPSEEKLDLTQYIYESIVLSLPYQRVHPEGQCNPEMMARFRIVSGEEFDALEAESEQQAPPAGEWAKLAELKERMEREEAESSAEKKTNE